MLINIDRTLAQPIYVQIIAGIKKLIDRGVIKEPQILSSTRHMARQLGVNRSTVIRAYEELCAQGYIESRPGSRYRVQERRKEVLYCAGRKSLISWEDKSNDEANRLYKTFLKFTPEGLKDHKRREGIINISELDLDRRIFPMPEFRRCINYVLHGDGSAYLEYGDHRGYSPLRQLIAQRLRLHGIAVSEEEILITNGAQQAIDLIIRMLSRPDAGVALEVPTYSIALPLFKFYGMKIFEVPMKPEGMDLNKLEEVLSSEKVSFVYTIPNCQNPTGVTSPHSQRERLLNICQKYGTCCVEDGFEEDMKYFGKVPLPVKSIDDKNIVLYIGTFSKALFPGLRIGWLTADKECISRLTAIKRFSDLGTGKLAQAALYEFLKRGYYDIQLKRMHRTFRKRMELALELMGRTFPDNVRWLSPTGGYTIWVRMPRKFYPENLYDYMASYGVIVSPGTYYFPEWKPSEYFRISIAKINEEEIQEGLKRLGRALKNLKRG